MADSAALDYVVVKPDRYDFGDGEVQLEHGTIIPGAVAETWGNGLMHLCNLGRLAPVPAVADDHPRKYDVSAPPPVIEAAEPGTTGEPVIEEPTADDVAAAEAHAQEVADLQAQVDAGNEEIAWLRAQLDDADKAPEEDGAEVLAWDSEEYLARFDATDAPELVEEIASWGTGDGTEDSPAVLKPPAEVITALREHEAATGNRQDVLDALDAQFAEPALDEPEADTGKPAFPQHKAAGVFTLSDGSEVKGKKAAIEAQAALDAAVPPEA